MSKKVAILQSNYIPWKGYFDIINSVDEFIIYDDVQYTKNDWRNRNQIKTKKGIEWLTIPVLQKNLSQTIRETVIADRTWNIRHWKTIQTNYARSTYFNMYAGIFEKAYCECGYDLLTEINIHFIKLINTILGIKTKISLSWEYSYTGEDKNRRLLSLLEKSGADIYLSGRSAKNYLDEKLFSEANIEISWIDYDGYPVYNQLFPPYVHTVSVIDLIFCEGPDSVRYMKNWSSAR